MNIIKATIDHLDDLAPLFDGYRMFYRQTSDLESARTFLKERIANNESVIYLAYLDNKPVGFTQLYPLFSSVSMQPMYLLNDLFVDGSIRGKGIGQGLIQAAKNLCIEKNYKGLAIQTESHNPAQHLYERVGFVKDPDLHLFWTNNSDK
jgi:GNAT superfamily N-acetyltransferase